MKKILLFAAAAMMFAGCTEKPTDIPSEDKIELSSNEASFDEKPGSTKIIVTSTGAWTLNSEEDYVWVTPSATKGVDSDIVTFTVVENLEQDRTAIFNFVCGKASATFKIISLAGELPKVELISGSEVTFGYEKGKLEIDVNSPLEYRQIKATVSEGSETWIQYQATLAGDTDREARVFFELAALEGLANRTAEVTITGEGLVPAVVKVSQLAKQVLKTASPFFKSELAGGELEVPVISNVEYEIVISEEGNGWLTHARKSENGEIFHVEPLAEGSRSAVVTFTQSNALEGTEPLSAEVTVSQIGTLISWAVEMNGSRLFPKWEGDQPNSSYQRFSLEMLFKPTDFNRPSGGIFTLMGIEDKFLVRFGDVGNAVDNLQVAVGRQKFNVPFFVNVKFHENVWYHLAVTFDAGHLIVYIDGKPVIDEITNTGTVNLFPEWSYEPTGTRTFWLGYSYDPNRDFHGLMTEVRAWAKVLTPEEINAKDHFYTVDPASEGLMTYWRFDEGQGDVIGNKATNPGSALVGNPLHGETEVRSVSGLNKGKAGIKWVPVALPLQ